MALSDYILTSYSEADIPTRPTNEGWTVEQLKEVLASRPDSEIEACINGIIEFLEGPGGAEGIGMVNYADITAVNVQDFLKQLADKRVIFKSANAKYLRVNAQLNFETSTDGTTWQVIGSGGHIILDKSGVIMPQRSKFKFTDCIVTDDSDNDLTIIQGIKGDAGATGAQGVQGIQGQQGSAGNTFVVKGLYASLEALQTAHATGNAGDAYAVGTVSDNYIYIWNVDTSAWSNIGQLCGITSIQGVQGEQGIPGLKGDTGDPGAKGDTGTSAFEAAVVGGYPDIEDNFNTQLAALPTYAKKVTSPTNGNFAGLDASGNLTDSGKKAADFATTANITTAVNTHASVAGLHTTTEQQTAWSAKAEKTLSNVSNTDFAAKATSAGVGGGGDGKRTANFTIGVSTAGWTTDDCDYLCDGVADQEEINAAITALPADGGEIVILDGTYNCTAGISVNKSNITISGSGHSTKLNFTFDGSINNEYISIYHSSTTIYYTHIKDLYISGNNKYGFNNCGIKDSGAHTLCCNLDIENCYYGIYGGFQSVVDGCNIYSNYVGIRTGSLNNIISKNRVLTNATGIMVDGLRNIVNGNHCLDNSAGIIVTGGNNLINGNVAMRGNGAVGDYTSSRYTVEVYDGATNNLVSDNLIPGKNYVNNGGTTNTFADNKYN